jgi:hypothetical protein
MGLNRVWPTIWVEHYATNTLVTMRSNLQARERAVCPISVPAYLVPKPRTRPNCDPSTLVTIPILVRSIWTKRIASGYALGYNNRGTALSDKYGSH